MNKDGGTQPSMPEMSCGGLKPCVDIPRGWVWVAYKEAPAVPQKDPYTLGKPCQSSSPPCLALALAILRLPWAWPQLASSLFPLWKIKDLFVFRHQQLLPAGRETQAEAPARV